MLLLGRVLLLLLDWLRCVLRLCDGRHGRRSLDHGRRGLERHLRHKGLSFGDALRDDDVVPGRRFVRACRVVDE